MIWHITPIFLMHTFKCYRITLNNASIIKCRVKTYSLRWQIQQITLAHQYSYANTWSGRCHGSWLLICMVKSYYKGQRQSRIFLRGGIVETSQGIFLFRLKSGINIESLQHITYAGLRVACKEIPARCGSISCLQADIGRVHEQYVYISASHLSNDIKDMRKRSWGRWKFP